MQVKWLVSNQIQIDELHAEDIFMIILLSARMKLFVLPLVHSLKTYESFLFIDKQRRIC
jgi:superfamily I DNA and RNA helicase